MIITQKTNDYGTFYLKTYGVSVIPAKAGIFLSVGNLKPDSRLRGNDTTLDYILGKEFDYY